MKYENLYSPLYTIEYRTSNGVLVEITSDGSYDVCFKSESQALKVANALKKKYPSKDIYVVKNERSSYRIFPEGGYRAKDSSTGVYFRIDYHHDVETSDSVESLANTIAYYCHESSWDLVKVDKKGNEIECTKEEQKRFEKELETEFRYYEER